MDTIEKLVCRTVGCCGPFGNWFEWPYRRICNPLALWRYRREGR